MAGAAVQRKPGQDWPELRSGRQRGPGLEDGDVPAPACLSRRNSHAPPTKNMPSKGVALLGALGGLRLVEAGAGAGPQNRLLKEQMGAGEQDVLRLGGDKDRCRRKCQEGCPGR